jgi:hypothetical protein
MNRVYTTNNVLIQIKTECHVDLLCYPRTTETGVALLHLNDSIDSFL